MEQAEDTRRPITLLIAVAVRLYRDGLVAVLKAHSHLCIVGSVSTAPDARAVSRSVAPDVVIVDVSMNDALDLMRALRSESPTSRILACAVRDELDAILTLRASARGRLRHGGTDTIVYEVTPRQEELASMSPSGIVDTLRNAVHRRRGHLQ